MTKQLEALYQELEIIEERITRKASGLEISRLLQMDNIAHLGKELGTLQKDKALLLTQAQALKQCPLCQLNITHMIHMKGD